MVLWILLHNFISFIVDEWIKYEEIILRLNGLTQKVTSLQNIPILFRSAESILISVIFIVYTASKCVFIIFISWKTKLDAQKTGVQIHKLANAIDEDHCYQVVNHLSLKLLNHSLNFTACGFFDLDMTTLYAVSLIWLGVFFLFNFMILCCVLDNRSDY